MLKIKLGIVTASTVATLAVTRNGSESTSEAVTFRPPDARTLNVTSTEGLAVSESVINAATQVPAFASTIKRWTKTEQRRYKQLVVKFSCSDLTETEKHELERLKVARAQFEDDRSSEEIIAEYQTRQNYAALLRALRKISI